MRRATRCPLGVKNQASWNPKPAEILTSHAVGRLLSTVRPCSGPKLGKISQRSLLGRLGGASTEAAFDTKWPAAFWCQIMAGVGFQKGQILHTKRPSRDSWRIALAGRGANESLTCYLASRFGHFWPAPGIRRPPCWQASGNDESPLLGGGDARYIV
jgi:hypothetical protein